MRRLTFLKRFPAVWVKLSVNRYSVTRQAAGQHSVSWRVRARRTSECNGQGLSPIREVKSPIE